MKRFLLIILVCLIPCFVFGSGTPGDNLGSHKAVIDLDMQQKNIVDAGTVRANNFDGNFSTGVPHIIECKAGENLTKGDVVYRSGAVGNKMQVSKADFDDAAKDQSIGFAFETKTNGQDILIIMNGMLHDLNTTGRAVGNVYLWESGDYIGTIPTSGVVQDIGELVRVHATLGSIYVHIHPVADYMSAGIGQDIDIRMGDKGGRIVHEDGQDNHLIETTPSSTTLKAVGTNVNSHELILEADDAGIKEIAKLQVIQGADPYLRISVSDDGTDGAIVNVIDIHDTVIGFVNDNTCDIGASGANRPKDYFGSGKTNVLKVETSSVVARDGSGTMFRNDAGTGGFHLHDDGSMDAKGSWNMEGHDINGADDIAGQSLTVTGEYSLPTADGNNGDVPTANGAGGVSWLPQTGAGNKNDEVNLEAEQFSTAGNTNNAAIYLHQKEITYDGVTSTAAMYAIKLPDSVRPNHAFASMNWSRQWDDVPVYIYVTFVTSSTSGGNANLRVGISTCAFAGGNFEIYDSTTSVESGWCAQRTATMTITSTSILVDGKHIMVYMGRGSEDTCVQTVYVLNVKFAFAKD